MSGEFFDMTSRYAFYFSPPTASPLGAFGASWLGRTIEGQDLGPPVLTDISTAVWRAATAAPRTYGFHATLRPPFRLASAYTEDDLISDLKAFCAQTAPVGLGDLKLARLAGFLALTPAHKDAIGRLAAEIIRHFDRYRPPLSPEEITRRRPDTLTTTQRALLNRWGYPYVMGEFRFHITLTGKLSCAETDLFEKELETRYQPVLEHPISIDSICVLRQRTPESDFVAMGRYPLGSG